MQKTDIKSQTLEELKNTVLELGEKPFRAKQLYEWMHVKLADDFDDVHCADLCGIFVQFVKKGDDLLLVRDGHIKSAEVGIFLYDFHKVIDVGYLKVYIFGVDILRFELFIEISDGKRMSQRIAY